MELKQAILAKKDNEPENADTFCCSHSKKACVVYFTQTTALAVILIWSLFMLTTTNDSNRDLYVSLLSTCIGVFLPQPTLKNLDVKE